MIVQNDVRYTGRRFEGAVVLPTHTDPLRFTCRVQGSADLDLAFVQRALPGHAVHQRTR